MGGRAAIIGSCAPGRESSGPTGDEKLASRLRSRRGAGSRLLWRARARGIYRRPARVPRRGRGSGPRGPLPAASHPLSGAADPAPRPRRAGTGRDPLGAPEWTDEDLAHPPSHAGLAGRVAGTRRRRRWVGYRPARDPSVPLRLRARTLGGDAVGLALRRRRGRVAARAWTADGGLAPRSDRPRSR